MYVTGNLYRPVGWEGPRPGVLSPHGHWADGRFYRANEKQIQADLKSSAEQFPEAAEYPLQARMVHLARMGCVVLHYDMIGYADHNFLDHRHDFSTVDDALWLLESMGLQTWNSLRALDFLCADEQVDPDKIAVTGASGGGTQTFVLAAIDDRVKVAVPAVMVSTAMQGGCICENAPYLRVETNNIALAALFAPKPLGLIGADDWTLQIATRGYPELRQIYQMYDAADQLQLWVNPQFGHNYNAVSRGQMYGWLKLHLGLERADYQEREFTPRSQQELTVFDETHPRPADALTAAQLRADWIAACERQLSPNVRTADPAAWREVLAGATETLFGGPCPTAEEITLERINVAVSAQQSAKIPERLLITRRAEGTVIPATLRQTQPDSPTLLVWFDEQGLQAAAERTEQFGLAWSELSSTAVSLLQADVAGCGANRPGGEGPAVPMNATYYGYTHGYEKPLLTRQVQDVLVVVVAAEQIAPHAELVLIGTGRAAPAVLLAQALLGDRIAEVHVDLQQHGFRQVRELTDPLLLPGALKYGGFGGLASLQPAPVIRIFGVNDELQQELSWLQETGRAVECRPEALQWGGRANR